MEARFRSEACALDETAPMARHRFGARGNALSFPLPWEDVLKALQGEGDQAAALPRSGAELGQLVRVLLKTNKKGKTSDAEIKGLIHQANVRREVVVNLILDMKRLGHPSFAGVDEKGVRLRVDADVDDAEDKLQPQKAATPCDGRQEDVAAAGATFAAQRARAVVAEGCAGEDANKAAVAALRKLRRDLEAEVEKREKPVQGDLTKLRFANLKPAARKILANVEARAKNIPGTHEVRKTMHTALMLRLARVREEDPALLRDGAKKFQARGLPALDEEFCRLSPEALAENLPNYEDRRALLARDPLACAEGFRTLVLLTLRHLLGVRFCPRCLNCATSGQPCSDAFGSNAVAGGGVLGRVDAVFGSIECQKSGALHAHMQVFVQCRHQRGSLAGLLDLGKPELRTLLQRYASYTAHVRRSVYCDPDGWERDRAAAEEEWPKCDCALMLSRPAYHASRRLRPEEWTRRYLAEDVEQLQQRKQHHVHLPAGPGSDEVQERFPPRQPVDSGPNGSGLPRLGRAAGPARQGQASSLGLQWGPVNDPNLNGNHPALLAALRCNGDLQVPYRFPVTKETHDNALCQEETCVGDGDVKLLVRRPSWLRAGNDPTAAESLKTAPVQPISLQFGLQLLEAAAAGE
ncbi:unnamed protein product, partial [Effrenium voratum]